MATRYHNPKTGKTYATKTEAKKPIEVKAETKTVKPTAKIPTKPAKAEEKK